MKDFGEKIQDLAEELKKAYLNENVTPELASEKTNRIAMKAFGKGLKNEIHQAIVLSGMIPTLDAAIRAIVNIDNINKNSQKMNLDNKQSSQETRYNSSYQLQANNPIKYDHRSNNSSWRSQPQQSNNNRRSQAPQNSNWRKKIVANVQNRHPREANRYNIQNRKPTNTNILEQRVPKRAIYCAQANDQPSEETENTMARIPLTQNNNDTNQRYKSHIYNQNDKEYINIDQKNNQVQLEQDYIDFKNRTSYDTKSYESMEDQTMYEMKRSINDSEIIIEENNKLTNENHDEHIHNQDINENCKQTIIVNDVSNINTVEKPITEVIKLLDSGERNIKMICKDIHPNLPCNKCLAHTNRRTGSANRQLIKT